MADNCGPPLLPPAAPTRKSVGKRKTVAEKADTKRKLDAARAKTRVNIGSAFERWRRLMQLHPGLKKDEMVTEFLLERRWSWLLKMGIQAGTENSKSGRMYDRYTCGNKTTTSKVQAKQASCSVVGCTSGQKSLFLLPTPEDLRTQWIHFVFGGSVPTTTDKVLYVCGNHFTTDCFLNESQYKAGLDTFLKIKHGSVPTVRDPSENMGAASTSNASIQFSATRVVACQTDPQPHFRSTGVQATVSCMDFGDGTFADDPFSSSSIPRKRKRLSKRSDLDLEEEDNDDPSEGSSPVAASQGLDVTSDVADSVTALTESKVLSEEASTPSHKIKKYIVYENCIMELFAVCSVCTRACDVRTRRLGTFLSVEQRCSHCEFYRRWNSQPILGSTPAGNLQLSAAVYLSGASFFKIERVFKTMQLQLFQYDTFRRHASAFIEPAVIHHWNNSQDLMLQRLSEEDKVIVGGDMRTDSAGHSAKFGIYAMMDLKTNTVVDIQLVQSNEVVDNFHMEKEGLKRSLRLLDAHGVTLECIVTDCHPQIQKFLGKSKFNHYYDVSLMEKRISKKLEKISKLKGCEKLQKWMRSIKNHMHWTAASSATGPERVAKWTSIINHIQDIHTHEDPHFPQCQHPLRQTRDKRKWLSAGTPALNKLKKVLTNKRTLKNVAKLSPHYQTSSAKAFHSVILRFAPKNSVFPFLGMLCRLYLAAMYYNENADRQQGLNNKGEPLFMVHFPKAMEGECRAKPVKTESTFRYVADMLDLIFEKVFVDPTQYMDAVLAIPIPDNLTAQLDPPDKEVIASYTWLNRMAV